MSEIKPENLTLFAKEGRLEEVKSVLALPNCNVNAVNERQQSALVLAAKGGFTEIVLELLNAKGIQVSHNLSGSTALHVACHAGHYPCIALLLAAGADRKSKSNLGNTPKKETEDKKVHDLLARAESSKGLESIAHEFPIVTRLQPTGKLGKREDSKKVDTKKEEPKKDEPKEEKKPEKKEEPKHVKIEEKKEVKIDVTPEKEKKRDEPKKDDGAKDAKPQAKDEKHEDHHHHHHHHHHHDKKEAKEEPKKEKSKKKLAQPESSASKLNAKVPSEKELAPQHVQHPPLQPQQAVQAQPTADHASLTLAAFQAQLSEAVNACLAMFDHGQFDNSCSQFTNTIAIAVNTFPKAYESLKTELLFCVRYAQASKFLLEMQRLQYDKLYKQMAMLSRYVAEFSLLPHHQLTNCHIAIRANFLVGNFATAAKIMAILPQTEENSQQYAQMLQVASENQFRDNSLPQSDLTPIICCQTMRLIHPSEGQPLHCPYCNATYRPLLANCLFCNTQLARLETTPV